MRRECIYICSADGRKEINNEGVSKTKGGSKMGGIKMIGRGRLVDLLDGFKRASQ